MCTGPGPRGQNIALITLFLPIQAIINSNSDHCSAYFMPDTLCIFNSYREATSKSVLPIL